jgi:hypothetical protein
MENSLKGLMLAAGIIITCVVISLGFVIAREAKDTASGGVNQLNMLNNEFVEGDKTLYDGVVVSGSEVLNVIRRFSDEALGILVSTNKDRTYYNYDFNEETGDIGQQTSNDYKKAQDVSSTKYINPTARFMGSIVRDVNGAITGLKFEQE